MTTSRMSRPRARRLAAAALIVALFFAAGTIGGRLATASAQGPAADPNVVVNPVLYQGLQYRSIGPHRGGRVTAISGVRQQPCTFYMGGTGGGVWKTDRLRRAVGTGERRADRNRIDWRDRRGANPTRTSSGWGRAARPSAATSSSAAASTSRSNAGRTWTLVGLRDGGQIGSVVIHPANPDIVWVAVRRLALRPDRRRGASTRPPTAARPGRARCS